MTSALNVYGNSPGAATGRAAETVRRDRAQEEVRADTDRWIDEGGSLTTAVRLKRNRSPVFSATTVPPEHLYRCPCQHLLQVFGGGRHRRYFELGDTRLDDPVMNGECPSCRRQLPGKNRHEVIAHRPRAGAPG
jgi:hypothetical protein